MTFPFTSFYVITIGGDDDLGLKMESLEEDSNGIRQGSLTHERICQQFGNQSSSQSIEMKRLSEAVLVNKNSCQASSFIIFLILFPPQCS